MKMPWPFVSLIISVQIHHDLMSWLKNKLSIRKISYFDRLCIDTLGMYVMMPVHLDLSYQCTKSSLNPSSGALALFSPRAISDFICCWITCMFYFYTARLYVFCFSASMSESSWVCNSCCAGLSRRATGLDIIIIWLLAPINVIKCTCTASILHVKRWPNWYLLVGLKFTKQSVLGIDFS